MFHSQRPVFRRAAAFAGGLLFALTAGHVFAGAQASADKEVAQQQVDANNAFPLHFELSVGGESEFVFRGVDILPQVEINPAKAVSEAVNALPAANGFPTLKQVLASKGFTPKSFAAAAGEPDQAIEASHESGIYYVEGAVSGYGFTLGAFYATQAEGRVEHNFLSRRPVFDSYHEFDSFLKYTRAVGPVSVSLGGTFYHVINNSYFDTAELNFGVDYTPRQFQYVTASFTYNYAGAFDFSNYNVGGVKGEYLDSHYLELRVGGNVPVYKHVVTFNPYILVSAGSGILPRAFNPASLPTFVNTERLAKTLEGPIDAIYQNALNPGSAPGAGSLSATRASYDPTLLDRSFDLSNAQVGFRIPIYLTRHITLRGDFNYSRPLGNLDREPYNQHDEIWGGGSVTLSF